MEMKKKNRNATQDFRDFSVGRERANKQFFFWPKEKGKNSNLTFQKNHMVRKKVRTQILLLKKKHMVRQKVRARSLLLKKKITL